MSTKSTSKDAVGDRMKRYEGIVRQSLLPRTPVIVRVDGRAFHTYTRGMDRPYDTILQDSMVEASIEVAKEMSGFKIGYTQSDETSFLLADWDTNETQSWFDNDQQKLSSLSAAIMTAHFNRAVASNRIQAAPFGMTSLLKPLGETLAFFDGRSFNVPMGPEIVNYFLWRAKDWERNSLSMYARNFFSAKQLHGKKKQDMHDMLHKEGKNWTKDVNARSRNGTFFFRDETGIIIKNPSPGYAVLSALISPLIGIDLEPKTKV